MVTFYIKLETMTKQDRKKEKVNTLSTIYKHKGVTN
jgi:hypothetical protein